MYLVEALCALNVALTIGPPGGEGGGTERPDNRVSRSKFRFVRLQLSVVKSSNKI